MKTRYISLLIIASIAVASCARHMEEDINPMDKDIVFRASWENSDKSNTKTALQEDGTSVWWSTEEKINVFYGNTRSGVFTSTNTSPAAEASFTGTLALKDGVTEDIPSAIYWAVYPYNENNTCDGESVTLTIPANQTATEGTFADNFFPAVARSKNSKLSFYNVCGGVRFSVYNEGITSVSIKSNEGESLVGTVKIVFDDNAKPCVSTVTAGGDVITVTAPEGGFVPGKYYFAAILPQSLTSGLKLTFVNAESKQAANSIDKAIVVNRSRFGILDEKDKNLDFVPEGCVQFSDTNFKAYCVKNFDKDGDGEVSRSEASTVTTIDVNTENIETLGGIEHFVNLSDLYCRGSYLSPGLLKELDLSSNTALYGLNCSYNQLTSLDVSNNTAITRLECYANQLTALDVTHNTALTELTCDNNQLTSLDVSHNTKLTDLVCSNNQLSSLDVSRNTALGYLNCSSNQLKSLDVSHNTELRILACQDNQLSTLDVCANSGLSTLSCAHNQLSSIDLSQNREMTGFYCSSNLLTSLDVSKNLLLTYLSCKNNPYLIEVWLMEGQSLEEINYNSDVTTIKYKEDTSEMIKFADDVFKAYCVTNFDIDGNGEISIAEAVRITSIDVKNKGITSLQGIEYMNRLNQLNCYFNQLTSLDVTHNTALTELRCEYNQLSSLDITHNLILETLSCENNQLTTLDVTRNTALKHLSCSSNQLTSLDITLNTILESLSIHSNQLTSLDVTQNTKLTSLICYSNQLTSLDVTHNTALGYINCDQNQLSSLDVSRNTALSCLKCASDQLSSIDISHNTKLEMLFCGNNQLTSLDVSNNSALTWIDCRSNQLTSLNVSNCTGLVYLYCPDNQLKTIDINAKTALTELNCNGNQLTSFDISNYKALERIFCGGNHLTSLDVTGCTALTRLSCENNQLTVLDVASCKELNSLTCYNNPNLSEIWFAKEQTIKSLSYDSYIATIKYRGIDDVPEAVDLGLSVKWASWNLGATKPEGYGDYYAWGETESYYISLSPLEWKSGKSGYDIESYKWCKGGYYTLTKYCTSNKTDYWGGDGSPDGMTQLEAKDDLAHVILGEGWRMPSDEEWTELLENCTWIWTTINSVNGFLFTSSKNGNSIFLPATGFWDNTLLLSADSAGCYWSSSLCSNNPHNAWYVSCNMGKVVRADTERSFGLSIRAVCK